VDVGEDTERVEGADVALVAVGIRFFGGTAVVREIAESFDLKVVENPFPGNVSGMLFRKGGRAVIGVNGAHSPTRKRFTIAHELGHYLLHEGNEFVDQVRVDFRDDRSSAGTLEQEVQANGFAAELLMPEQLVRDAHMSLAQAGIEPEGDAFVARLADTFEVSHEAMSYRLVNLGLGHQI